MRFSMIFAAALAFGGLAAAPASAETTLTKSTVSVVTPAPTAATPSADQWRGRYGYRGYGYGNRGWRGYRGGYRSWGYRYRSRYYGGYRPRYYGGYRYYNRGWNRGYRRGWRRW